MKIKECSALVKAMGDDPSTQGQFSAIVSVFGNKDSVGDVVLPGAFTDTLAQWKASGNPIPVIWSHDWADPYSHIGYSTNAEELAPGDPRLPDDLKANGGLLLDGQLDTDSNPKAMQVYRLLKGGRVSQFSFAYDVLDGAPSDDGSSYFLKKLSLFEAGPTLVGANQLTDLLAVKAAEMAAGFKEGRELSAKNLEHIDAAIAHLTQVKTGSPKTSSPDGEKDTSSAAQDPNVTEPDVPATQDASRPETTADAAAEQAAADVAKSGAAQAIARLQLATI